MASPSPGEPPPTGVSLSTTCWTRVGTGVPPLSCTSMSHRGRATTGSSGEASRPPARPVPGRGWAAFSGAFGRDPRDAQSRHAASPSGATPHQMIQLSTRMARSGDCRSPPRPEPCSGPVAVRRGVFPCRTCRARPRSHWRPSTALRLGPLYDRDVRWSYSPGEELWSCCKEDNTRSTGAPHRRMGDNLRSVRPGHQTRRGAHAEGGSRHLLGEQPSLVIATHLVGRDEHAEPPDFDAPLLEILMRGHGDVHRVRVYGPLFDDPSPWGGTAPT